MQGSWNPGATCKGETLEQEALCCNSSLTVWLRFLGLVTCDGLHLPSLLCHAALAAAGSVEEFPQREVPPQRAQPEPRWLRTPAQLPGATGVPGSAGPECTLHWRSGHGAEVLHQGRSRRSRH